MSIKQNQVENATPFGELEIDEEFRRFAVPGKGDIEHKWLIFKKIEENAAVCIREVGYENESNRNSCVGREYHFGHIHNTWKPDFINRGEE